MNKSRLVKRNVSQEKVHNRRNIRNGNMFLVAAAAALLSMSAESAFAQNYNEDDKEGLRIFLRQPSAEEGKINAQQLGVNDTSNWYANEDWVEDVIKLAWNNDVPRKRLTQIGILNEYYNMYEGWEHKNLKGNLDATKWDSLMFLLCDDNQLSTLNVRTCTALQILTCSSNQLSVLDVSANTALTNLVCGNNPLSALDVSKNTRLSGLYCYNNQLSTLDVSNNTSLFSLNCENNPLSTLDVSKNTELRSLYCSNNQLSSLDVSKNTALWGLICRSNQLSALDVSKNTDLMELVCSNNHLSALDLTGLNDLSLVYFNGNGQTAAFTLYNNDSGVYESTFVLLNSPIFSNNKIVYANNKITSTKNTVVITSFIVETNKSGFQLNGTMNFNYSEDPPPLGIVGANNYSPLRVYPNPTTGQLKITNYDVSMGEIGIYDIVGQKLLNYQIIDDLIDISHLANGLYFLKIGNRMVKIVKE